MTQEIEVRLEQSFNELDLLSRYFGSDDAIELLKELSVIIKSQMMRTGRSWRSDKGTREAMLSQIFALFYELDDEEGHAAKKLAYEKYRQEFRDARKGGPETRDLFLSLLSDQSGSFAHEAPKFQRKPKPRASRELTPRRTRRPSRDRRCSSSGRVAYPSRPRAARTSGLHLAEIGAGQILRADYATTAMGCAANSPSGAPGPTSSHWPDALTPNGIDSSMGWLRACFARLSEE